MRDEHFFLLGAASTAPPPFSYFFVDRPWPAHGWSLRDGVNRQVGTARTRAGARAGVRALYARDLGEEAHPLQPQGITR